MKHSGLHRVGRIACQLAGCFEPPFYGRISLSRFGSCGYISPSAVISHPLLALSKNCFIGDGVTIYQDRDGKNVVLMEGVHIHQRTTLQTGKGGKIIIGKGSHIQPSCQISAYKGSVHIGKNAEIAPNCAFYPYDHSFFPNVPVRKQELQSKGDIVIGNNVWIGYGVVILAGVHVHDGAVIGAGSVVTNDIPENKIAAGNPARIINSRDRLER